MSPMRCSRTSRPGMALPESRWRCWAGSIRPVWSLAGSLFGALEAGAGAMQRDADIPAVAVYVVEAVVIVVALLATVPEGGWAAARASSEGGSAASKARG